MGRKTQLLKWVGIDRFGRQCTVESSPRTTTAASRPTRPTPCKFTGPGMGLLRAVILTEFGLELARTGQAPPELLGQ